MTCQGNKQTNTRHTQHAMMHSTQCTPHMTAHTAHVPCDSTHHTARKTPDMDRHKQAHNHKQHTKAQPRHQALSVHASSMHGARSRIYRLPKFGL